MEYQGVAPPPFLIALYNVENHLCTFSFLKDIIGYYVLKIPSAVSVGNLPEIIICK